MSRVPELIAALQSKGLDALLLTGPVNRRWATGFHSSAGALVVTKAECVFITDSRYIEGARALVGDTPPCTSPLHIVQIGAGQSYAALVAQVTARNHVRRLGFEENVMTQGVYTAYRKTLVGATVLGRPPIEFIPASELLDDLRASKTPEEYALMRRAQAITDQTFAQILPLLSQFSSSGGGPEGRGGLTERELAAEIVYHLMKNGAERPAFDPIVVSGSRSSMPHGTPGDDTLTGFVTMDFGAVYKGYCADMTRTVCLGEPTAEMRRVYDTVLEAQLAGIAAAKAGVAGREIDRAARDVIKAAGYGDYFGHGFGHSLGLEVHESLRAAPTEERKLPPGAVISAEPGIYLPGKFGVRIEDTLYLTETGCEILTKTPKELVVI